MKVSSHSGTRQSSVCSGLGWQACASTALTIHQSLTLLLFHGPLSLLLGCSDLWSLVLVSLHSLVLL